MHLNTHISQITRTCFFHLRNIAKLRSLVSFPELEMIIHAFVSSRLDYCNSLFTCLNKTTMDRLQLIQNTAARLLTRTSRRCHITPVLASLHWLPVNFRVHFKLLVLTYRALHQCFSTYFEPRHTFYLKKIPHHTTNQKCFKMTHLQ